MSLSVYEFKSFTDADEIGITYLTDKLNHSHNAKLIS